jgi:hypothetical protein
MRVKLLCAMLNIPQPPSFNTGSAVAEVSESSMTQAATKPIAENEEDGTSHCLDGSWQNVGTLP